MRHLGRVALLAALIAAALGQLAGFSLARPPRLAHAAAGLVITPSSGVPNSLVTVFGGPGSLPPNAAPLVMFVDANGSTSSNLGPVRANADGSFSRIVVIPVAASGGTATIAVQADTPLTAPFQVLPVLTASPQAAPPGSTVRVTGAGYRPLTPIQFSVGGASASAALLVISDALGGFATSVFIPANAPGGQVALVAFDGTAASLNATAPIAVLAPTPSSTPNATATATDTASATGTPSPTPPSSPTTAYFAEGYTGVASTNRRVTFTETLNIFNPGAAAAPVTITYYVEGTAAPRSVVRQVPPTSAMRELVNADIGGDLSVAAAVTSPQRIVVTRTITRVSPSGARLDGSTTVPAVSPATRWDFAEGYTGITFQEYLTLLNPNPAAATVHVVLAPQAESAAGARTLTLTVPPQSRSTANMRALNAGPGAQSVGMLVRSDLPVVAERVIYFGPGAGSGKFGSTVSTGLAAAATLRIPYASSGGTAPDPGGTLRAIGDQAYLTLLNPASGGPAIDVTAGFVDAIGQPLGRSAAARLAPGTRQTIALNQLLGGGPIRPFSVAIAASGPIVAESAQYDGGSPNLGQHPGVTIPAVASAAAIAYLSGLETSYADGAPVLRALYLYNPGGAPITVSATYYASTGASTTATYAVPPGGVALADPSQSLTALPPGPVGAVLRLSGGSGGFVAVAIGQTVDGLSLTEEPATSG